jgi:hypothetical protein
MAQSRLITDLIELVKPNNDDVLVIVDNTTNPALSVTKKIKYSNLVEDLQDMIDLFIQDGTGIDATYNDAGNTITISVVPDTTVQRTIVSTGGTTVGTRQELNVVPGAGITLDAADNPTDNRIDLTVNTTTVSTGITLSGTGSPVSPLQSVSTLGNGTKQLNFRGIKPGSSKLSVTTADGGNSISIDVVPSGIDINTLAVGSPLAIALGGTNATTASGARASLGAAQLGTNSDITELTSLTTPLSVDQGGTGGNTAQTGLFNLAGISNAVSVGATGQSLIVNGKNPVVGEYRAEFKTIRAASSRTSVSTVANEITVDANANVILSAASANPNFNGFRLTNIAAPIAASDAATKEYADSVAQGLTVKEASRLASTINFSSVYYNATGTVSAVTTGTDSLTINNHPFNVGERVYISSTAALPGGLSALTEYFVIDTDANTIKLAASKADALANSPIDITSTGSGTIVVAHTKYLEATGNGLLSIDGENVAQGDRVLLKDQSTASENGIYVVTEPGDVSNSTVLTRANDANDQGELEAGAFTFIFEGATHAGVAYVQIESSAVFDVDPLTWTVFSAAAIPVNSVDNDRLVQVAEATVKGRRVGIGSGNVEDLSANDLIAVVNSSTAAISGVTIIDAVLSGVPTAPTATSGTSTTQIATTAFVAAEISGGIGTTIQPYDANTAKTDIAQTFTAAQRGTIGSLAGSGTVTPDFSIANNFEMVLSGTTTLAFPSGVASGQSGAIRISQGNKFVVSYSGAWQFPNSTPPSNTVVSGAADLLVYYAHSASGITAQLLPNVG